MPWGVPGLATAGDLMVVLVVWHVMHMRTTQGTRYLREYRSTHVGIMVLMTGTGWMVIIHGASHPLAMMVTFPLAAGLTMLFRRVSLDFSGVD